MGSEVMLPLRVQLLLLGLILDLLGGWRRRWRSIRIGNRVWVRIWSCLVMDLVGLLLLLLVRTEVLWRAEVLPLLVLLVRTWVLCLLLVVVRT